MKRILFQLALWACLANILNSVCGLNAAPATGAALLKTDIMAVFAHPDDETGMAATLAYYARARNAAIANVYCTRGEGGGNMVGTQWGAALGLLREAELRNCLATIGVRDCYFLDQLDWAYTESLQATLNKWGKEPTLERLVRLVRALRPEVMVTMNPTPSPGQHGHHQAAGVLATEAFTAAADPNRFPLQLSKEGLTVWQPRRLFYGGASTNQLASTIAVSDPLPDGRTPAAIAGLALANHRSQAFGNFGDSPWLRRPQRFLLVKAFVPNTGLANDLLGGLPTEQTAEERLEFRDLASLDSITISLTNQAPPDSFTVRFIPRPAVLNYKKWISDQKIEHVGAQFHADLPVVAGEANNVQLELDNQSGFPVEGELKIDAPHNWKILKAPAKLKLPPKTVHTIPIQVIPPPDATNDEELRAQFTAAAYSKLTATKLHPLPRVTVPRIKRPAALDGSSSGWDNIRSLEITPHQLVQGKVASAADSSALFRLAHDSKTLYIDIEVKDDLLVTNIAPNDIRGHWRSDSVEICLDPIGGAEHTMGCYKLGVFPFDSSGTVRAARDADANQGPVEETAPRTRLASTRTPDGYRLQAAIPFDEIGLKKGQKKLGFNLIIYDGDKADAAPGENINKSRIAWAPRSGVQGRPEDWGRIELE